MKTRALLLILVMLFVLAVPVAAVVEEPCPEEVIVPLRYGRDTVTVGSVTAWFEEDSLMVKYEVTGDWYLTEIHLIAVKDLAEVPATPNDNNNPRIGHFPVSESFDPYVQEYTAEVPLDEAWEVGDTLYILAHAALVRVEGGGVVQDETAWGGEEEFTSQRFAYYFTVTICEPDDEDPNGEDPNGEDPDDPGDDPNGEDPNGEDPDDPGDDPNGEDPNGEDPEDPGDDDDELPVTGTPVGWLVIPGLAMAGAGLAALRRRR